MTKRGSTLIAMIAIIAVMLTGCRPSNDQVEGELADAVVAVSPEIDGALVRFSSSGFSSVLSVKAYIPDAEGMAPEELADIVTEALEELWFGTPNEIDTFYFGVVPSTKPDDATMSQPDAEPFHETAKLLDTSGGFSDGTFGFSGPNLELRFGARP